MTKSEMRAFIEALLKIRESATDASASASTALYPTLKGNGSLIKAGTRINHNGTIKRAAVDLYDTAENTPENAPVLWENIQYKDGYRIIPEVITAGLAFSIGEYGWWQDKLYKSLIDSNVWTPDAHPGSWEEVVE